MSEFKEAKEREKLSIQALAKVMNRQSVEGSATYRFIAEYGDKLPECIDSKSMTIVNYKETRISEDKVNELIEYLYYYIKLIDNPKIFNLALDTLRKYGDYFFFAPAAQRHHHNYPHGLLEHTVGIMHIAHNLLKAGNHEDMIMNLLNEANVSKSYTDISAQLKEDDVSSLFNRLSSVKVNDKNNLNKVCYDKIMLAIVFHDMGKIFEYTGYGDTTRKWLLWPGATFDDVFLEDGPKPYEINMERDPLFNGHSHVSLGPLLLADVIESSLGKLENEYILDLLKNKQDDWNEFSISTVKEVNHMLLAHHGRLEWGSPVTPQSMNAFIVHLADLLDARLANTETLGFILEHF